MKGKREQKKKGTPKKGDEAMGQKEKRKEKNKKKK